MKVLHVIPSVGPLRGGPSFAIRSITKGLSERGVETHVATTDDNGPSDRLAVKLGVPVEEDGAVFWYFRRQTSFYIGSWPFTLWLWRHARDYDLIHIHALFSYCPSVAALIARRKGVPYIIRPLGVLNRWGMVNRRPLLKRISFSLLEKRLLRDAAFIHYTAEQERSEAAECGFRHKPMIIPNPVDVPDLRGLPSGQFRRRYPALRDRRIVLFLSRIDRKKGLDLLIPAFQKVLVDFPDTVLVIAGDGDAGLIGELRTQCRDLNIESSVFWPGFLDGPAKFEALAGAEIFVLPSYSENFGIAVIEAMAAGVPVIITDQVGIWREVSGEKAGLVTTAEAEPLRGAIVRLLADEASRASMGANGVALVRSYFARGIVIEKLMDAYRSILTIQENVECRV
jgi:glycosyltransferase involved in cell wall biosynthesis